MSIEMSSHRGEMVLPDKVFCGETLSLPPVLPGLLTLKPVVNFVTTSSLNVLRSLLITRVMAL